MSQTAAQPGPLITEEYREMQRKVLSDGRNAHLIQQPPRWWLPRIMDRFELMSFNRMNEGFFVTVQPKRR